MYDVLFIDDHFEEINDTFRTLQKEHIRCFYSDGDKYLPSNDKEKLPFKNLKYICLDFYLENRGLSPNHNKNTISTLAGVVKSFTENKDVRIIINTSSVKEFTEHRNDFVKYLKFEPEIIIENKEKKDKEQKNGKRFSSLHDKAIKNEIVKRSHQSVLRNLVIREAIEIENLIWSKILLSDAFKDLGEVEKVLEKLKIKMFFNKKIQTYNRIVNREAETELEELRDTRNKFAHNETPPEKNLLDFLEEIEALKRMINHE